MGKKARLFPSGELKLHCRSLLFSLIQLSTYYASKNPDGFDGWFFRSNHSLEAFAGIGEARRCR